MRKTLFLFMTAGVFAFVGGHALAAKGPAPKVGVCHAEDDKSSYHLINISENAKPAHMAHGDAAPGASVPGNDDKKFDSDCNMVDRWELVQTITLDPSIEAGVNSNILNGGTNYRFDVSGTWENRPGEDVDVEYSTPDNWTTHTDAPYGGFLGGLLDVQLDNSFIDWGAYASSHEYTHSYVGNNASVNFRVFDGDVVSNTPISGWYTDNVGSLTIKIYEMN